MRASERTFNNFMKLNRANDNRGRYENANQRQITHEYSNKKFIQKYGNSYLISLPKRQSVLVIGPHWLGVIVTVFIIWGGTWLNLGMLAKHHEFSAFTLQAFELFITFFFISTHILLFLTATTDPGIIFKTDSCCNSSENEFHLNESEYCEICEVYQPDEKRIHHCYDCNYCIEGMDHHCPWMVSVYDINLHFDYIYGILVTTMIQYMYYYHIYIVCITMLQYNAYTYSYILYYLYYIGSMYR